MSVSNNEMSNKWMNTFIALVCALIVFLMVRFFAQMNEWFELEVKISNYTLITQVIAVLLGVGCFIYSIKNKKIMQYLGESFSEMEKVVFPDRSETFKQSIQIIIVVTIVGFFLSLFDFGAGYLLSLLPTF